MERKLSRSAQAAELDRATARILTEQGRAGRAVYLIGSELAKVQQLGAWAARHGSFDGYVENALGMAPRSAYRFMRIAAHFNAEIAARYGVTKLDAALRYLRATKQDEAPGDLLAADLRVRGPNGRYETVSLHEATTPQIIEAARDLERRKQRPAGESRGLRRRATKLAEGFPPPPSGIKTRSRLRLQRGDDGRLAITLRAIALDDLAALVATLERELADAQPSG